MGDEHHNKPVSPYPCHLQGGNQVKMAAAACWNYTGTRRVRGNTSRPTNRHCFATDFRSVSVIGVWRLLTSRQFHFMERMPKGSMQVRNKGGGSKQCLDWSSHGAKSKKVGLYWCHNQGGNQVYSRGLNKYVVATDTADVAFCLGEGHV